jgi:hypothetical protein
MTDPAGSNPAAAAWDTHAAIGALLGRRLIDQAGKRLQRI